MAKPLCLQVPVKPHTLQYLVCKLGDNYQLNRSHAIGLHLYNLLRRRTAERDYAQYLKRYCAHFAVRIGKKNAQEGCWLQMPAHVIVDFNSFIESLFYDEFFEFVRLREEVGRTLVQARDEFRAKYGLTAEHINDETLIRTFQRRRRRYEESKTMAGKKLPVLVAFRGNSLPSLLPSAA